MSLYELGLTEEDFNFEIIESGNYRILKTTVKGITIENRLHVTREKIEDFKIFYNQDAEKMLENLLKKETILSVINDKRFIRKLKLNKLNDFK